jgi:hypothetical protein
MIGTVSLGWFFTIHVWPFLAPSATTKKSAQLRLILDMVASALMSSTVPKPGHSNPTHLTPLKSALRFRQAISATPSGPPKKKTDRLAPLSFLRVSNRPDPATRSGMGIPNNLPTQTNGIPSTTHKSLLNAESRNASSARQATTQLMFGVDRKQGLRAHAASRIFLAASLVSIASNGKPNKQ